MNGTLTKVRDRTNFEVALGPLRQYLDDATVQDVNVNPDGAIWVNRGERGKTRAPETMDGDERQSLISTLAGRQGVVIDALRSRIAGDVPYWGTRFQAFAPPVGAWALCLRCHSRSVVPITELGTMLHGPAVDRPATLSVDGPRDQEPFGAAAALRTAVARGENIAIVGMPGAGKTFLLKSLLHEAARVRPHLRLVTLEDRREIEPSHADGVQLYADGEQVRPDGSYYTYGFVDLLKDALRTSFDMLAFGELRDGESARALLLAMNCGVSGLFFTMHAASAREALTKLEDLIALSGAPVIRRTIARFVTTIVYVAMEQDPATGERFRSVAEVLRVTGVDNGGNYTTSGWSPYT